MAAGDWAKLDLHSNPTAHAFLGAAAAWMMVDLNMFIYDMLEIYFYKQK